MATSAQPVVSGNRPLAATPEKIRQVLLACCSVQRESRSADFCRTFQDWPQLLDLAQKHGVLPQVYGRLMQEQVPPSALAGFSAGYQLQVRRAVLLTGELMAVLECLRSAQIEALPYKGAVLAEMLYGDVAARQFGDIDLLIRPHDVSRAITALQALGYRPALQLTAAQHRAYLKSGYEYTLDSARGRNVLEVQWNVLPHFYAVDFAIEDLFRGARRVEFQGRSILSLAPETLLLVLAVHAAKHAWEKLAWLCDLVQLVKTQKLDWPALREQSRRLGVERILGVNFLLARNLLGAEIPDRLATDSTAQAIAQEIAEQTKRGESYHPESSAYFRLMLGLRERWSDRARFLWRLACTPSTGEWAAVRLPEKLFPLYRGVRMARLLRRLAG
jgi:hypothetical protein